MVGGGGEREIIFLLLHCHHQNDSCITMGSDERHFNVSLIVRDKVTSQFPQNTTLILLIKPVAMCAVAQHTSHHIRSEIGNTCSHTIISTELGTRKYCTHW